MQRLPIAAPVLCLALLPLTACQSVETAQPSSQLRVIDAAVNSPAVNLLIGQNTVFSNLSPPVFSNYAPVSIGDSTLTLRDTGLSSGGTASTLDATAGDQYSYLLLDSGTTFTTSVIQDQSVSAPGGDVSLRVISDTPATGPLDIYIVPTGTSILLATPVFSGVKPGTVSAYVNLGAADVDIIATSAGTTTVRLTVTGTTFSSGQVRTLLFMDRKYVVPAAVSLVVGDDVN